jgi:hypothetical protein
LTVGRHSRPDAGHRRRGTRPSQLALAALIAVGLVLLFGTAVEGERGRTVSGTFTGAQSAEQPPPSVAALPPTAEPSTAVSEPPSMDVPTTETMTPPLTAAPAPAAEHFTSCAQAKAAGVSLIPYGDPQYSPDLDHDGDGIACDQHGDPPTRYRPPPPAPPCTCPR